MDIAQLAADIRALRRKGDRLLLGLSGAPGAGKTTLAEALVAELGERAVQLPMDGYHLADVTLDALGIRDRKGAPETFDAHGYARMLRTLAERPDHVVYAPGFERELEQPIAAAVAVRPDAEIVVTEGNYLLLDRPGWREARAALDVVWHLRVDDELRRRRLVERHVRFGKDAEAAAAWVRDVDERNAALVEAAAHRADRIIG